VCGLALAVLMPCCNGDLLRRTGCGSSGPDLEWLRFPDLSTEVASAALRFQFRAGPCDEAEELVDGAEGGGSPVR
jgi:hypothetical protein